MYNHYYEGSTLTVVNHRQKLKKSLASLSKKDSFVFKKPLLLKINKKTIICLFSNLAFFSYSYGQRHKSGF